MEFLTKITLLMLIILAEGRGPHEDLISPLLKTNTHPHNPGIYIRLMPTGLAYLREIGMKVVNEEVLRIQIPTITENVDAGQVSISNVRVSKYWAPPDYDLELFPPSMFTWSMSRMHLRAVGNFEAVFNNPLLLPATPISGQFETLFGHVSLTISVRMMKTEAGAPWVHVSYCRSLVGYVDLNVQNTGVITDLFINAFKAFIIANVKPMIEDRMCAMIRRIVNKNMNDILATMPLQVRLNKDNINILSETFGISGGQLRPRSRISEYAATNVTLLNLVHYLRQRNLVLDYRLLSDPQIRSGAIEMAAKGEVSWNGQGQTPFSAPNINILPPSGVHMVEFIGTDYMANSLLYHAFRQHFIDVVIGPESSPQLKTLLLTTCSSVFCIGEYLGDLSTQYPDREVEVRFAARKSPVLVFIENRARFRIHGTMNFFVRPSNLSQVKTMIIRSETTMTANIRLWINDSRVVGNASVENLDFKLRESRVRDVDQASFADLGLFGAEFLEQLLTEILQIGILIPTMEGVQLRSPTLTLHDRYLKVRAFFKLDEPFAEELIEGAVRQTLYHIG
ncbi:hypothetical protein AB6A40_005389 [Gnathostoma spinigerum]|uniref:Lipopolysaccharide-binding protein n=1 Tax=Gnathostoma spinigerum TaxID=75299 RepID=A0ABD6EFA2_9BILA